MLESNQLLIFVTVVLLYAFMPGPELMVFAPDLNHHLNVGSPRVKHSALSQFLDIKDEVILSLIMKFPKPT
ncbi:hypothetical protein AB6E36_21490, partial [Vibrio cyclitrophicus]